MVKTALSNLAAPCPLDRVNRQFRTPATNVLPIVLRISEFIYVPTWQGFAYVAFVIDVFARRIVHMHKTCAAAVEANITT